MLTDAQIDEVLKSINFGYWTGVTKLARAIEAAVIEAGASGAAQDAKQLWETIKILGLSNDKLALQAINAAMRGEK